MKELRSMVLSKIEKIESNSSLKEELKKYQLILKILDDDACFFKMSIRDAYSILVTIGVEEPMDYYKKMISSLEYQKLIDHFMV